MSREQKIKTLFKNNNNKLNSLIFNTINVLEKQQNYKKKIEGILQNKTRAGETNKTSYKIYKPRINTEND